jgi:hypothetical protein
MLRGAKDVGRGVARGAAALPADLAYLTNAVLPLPGRSERMASAERMSEGAKQYMTQLLGAPEESQMAQTGGEFIGPPVKAGVKAAITAKDLLPMLLGAIRRGGDPFLQVTHGTTPWKLAKVGSTIEETKPFKELSSPSFAVSDYGSEAIPFYHPSSGALVIPKVGAVDPLKHPSTVYNRDAFVQRGADVAEDLNNPELRLLHRFWTDRDLKLREVQGSTGAISHDVAIKESPIFPSFKAYETSPAGSATLRKAEDPDEWGRAFHDRFMQWGGRTIGNRRAAHTDLTVAAMKGDTEAQELLKLAKNAPSDYAEVKTHGPLALTPEKVAGVILPEPTGLNEDIIKLLRGEYGRRKIPTETVGSDWDIRDVRSLIDELQKAAGPYGG